MKTMSQKQTSFIPPYKFLFIISCQRQNSIEKGSNIEHVSRELEQGQFTILKMTGWLKIVD